MAVSDDLINFELIEQHKENIQQLPGGRSAKQLTTILSPHPSGQANLDETKTLNDAIRKEYELELQSIADSDDPLDIYDRYVKWTLNAYPSAQATPQSQLLPLLERATKAFLTSSHYKNDPRYLKLWLHYIRLFSDAPRETFAFLARHHIGETLGLFYEEFAAWLEGADRWNQAEEVYKLGIEREARPAERLMRKYNQFQQRFAARPQNSDEPSSPALPTVRPALAAKMDPFASIAPEDPQTRTSTTVPPSRSGKPKMAIFLDADSAAPVPNQTAKNGWDSIGSMKERKKENIVEARPWVGETLSAGGRVGAVSKMEVFKDPSRIHDSSNHPPAASSSDGVKVRPRRPERVFVNIAAIYPNEEQEFSFEELRAMSRGWSTRNWRKQERNRLQPVSGNAQSSPRSPRSSELGDVENLSQNLQQHLSIIDTSTQSLAGMPESKLPKPRRVKVREVKQEVQTVKTRLDSPTGRKIRRKGSSEATMTFHSKAATNEIYDMFNQPLQAQGLVESQSGEDSDEGDDTYSTAGESTGTGRISVATSEFGDDTLGSVRIGEEHTGSQPTSVSPWSEFTASKHVPKVGSKGPANSRHRALDSDDMTDNVTSSQNPTQTSGMGAGFDTQAIEALANQDFDELDTKAIALIAGNDEPDLPHVQDESEGAAVSEELKTPAESTSSPGHVEIHNKPRYIPLPPEDYEPTPHRPYRDPNQMAQNKLPFMTPIVERTESSLASTVFKEGDYFNPKTPSRSAPENASKYDSPSKLKLDELLMSSPQKESPRSISKRRLSGPTTAEEEILTSSPQKRKATGTSSPVKVLEDSQPLFALVQSDEKVEEDVKTNLKVQVRPSRSATQGPIIPDLQCNPCDAALRQQILDVIIPPLSSYDGYHNASSETFNQYALIRSYADKVAKQKNPKFSPRKSQNENKGTTKLIAPILDFGNSGRVYAVKRELGKGAFAPVYLVDSHAPTSNQDDSQMEPKSTTRSDLEAVKSESPPCTLTWEFHILHLVHSRLPPSSRVLHSIITAHELHVFADEAYLVLDYIPQGTLLDLMNAAKAENARQGKAVDGTGLDESLALFFGVELIRTVAALHENCIVHGDLKGDNCLVRFDAAELVDAYNRRGEGGWCSKGLKLIDFGRGIDVDATVFDARIKFMADWEAHPEEAWEVREGRLWKWVVDWWGVAGVLHCLLFGKYLETVPVTSPPASTVRHFPSNRNDGDGHDDGETSDGDDDAALPARDITLAIHSRKQYRPKDVLKRYWEKHLWTDIFHVLLNIGQEENDERRMGEIGRVQSVMETWLEAESERSGRDLRAVVRRAERVVGGRRG